MGKLGRLLDRDTTDELLREIEAFCAQAGIAERAFGVDCFNNGAFVRSLRLDRPRLYERRVAKARRFIEEWQGKAGI